MNSVLIAISTFNEIENLPRLVDEIFQHTLHADVLIIDDNSPDGTGRWAQERAERDVRVDCIVRAGKLGLGSATLLGLSEAKKRGYEFVITMDADFSHHPGYLSEFISGMVDETGEIDVMIGTRYAKGGRIEGWPRSRRIMSRLINAYARFLLGLRVSDCSGAYRCYRTSILRKLDFDQVRSDGYSFFEEILWHLKNVNAKFGELGIVFIDRELGHSKISFREAIRAVYLITATGLTRHR